MNAWIEVSLEVDGEGAETVADALRRYVHQGVVIEQTYPGEVWPEEITPAAKLSVRAYFPDDHEAAETKRQIQESLYYLGKLYPLPEPSFRTVKEEDWADAWKQHYHPIRVGKRLLIKPAWIDVETGPDDITIEMDPGMAFGTGTHPTTQLCLMACEWFAKPGMCMVDLGTGSGILSIAAAKLGCYKVLGRDIDETAVRVAQENIKRNGVDDRVTIQHGSLAGLVTSNRHFDLAMANITARVILPMTEEGLQYVVWPGGRFIFSGIIDDQADEVITALEAINLTLEGQRQMGDWVMLITRRTA